MAKIKRNEVENYCLVCGERFVAKRRARYCGVACRVFAFRHAVPFSRRNTLPDCPWDLFDRVGSWECLSFQVRWFAWASEAWKKSGQRVAPEKFAASRGAAEKIKGL